MPRTRRLIAPRLLYHVMARGNHRQATFGSPGDYSAYQERLIRYQTRHAATLLAYCLMPNHVHLLIRTSDVPVSKFMQGLQQSYTQRFNRLYGTVGHLFQGRYRSLVCDSDEYLAALVGYVHLNPVRAGLVDRPEQYPYSSHSAYLRGKASPLLDPTYVLAVLGGPRAYREYVLNELAREVVRTRARTVDGRTSAIGDRAHREGRGFGDRTARDADIADALALEAPHMTDTVALDARTATAAVRRRRNLGARLADDARLTAYRASAAESPLVAGAPVSSAIDRPSRDPLSRASTTECSRRATALDEAITVLARAVGLTPEVLQRRDRAWAISRPRAAVLHVLTRTLGYERAVVARAFGLDVDTLTTLVARAPSRPESAALIAGLSARLAATPTGQVVGPADGRV